MFINSYFLELQIFSEISKYYEITFDCGDELLAGKLVQKHGGIKALFGEYDEAPLVVDREGLKAVPQGPDVVFFAGLQVEGAKGG